MSDASASVHPASADLPHRLKTSLSEIRFLLLHNPTRLSLASTGPLLEQIASDLAALPTLVPPPSREDLLEIHALSSSVQSLYRAALNYFAGLASETIEQRALDGASYSASGEWQARAAGPTPRLTIEG